MTPFYQNIVLGRSTFHKDALNNMKGFFDNLDFRMPNQVRKHVGINLKTTVVRRGFVTNLKVNIKNKI